jgi:hypothetical protein
MVVKTHCNGRTITGLVVGAVNARRYFPRDAAMIELQLDHLLIGCALAPDFWHGHSEIRDPRLGLWLESKNFKGKPGDGSFPMAMIPSGKNAFRVLPIAVNGRPKIKPAAGPVHPARAPHHVAQGLAVAAAVGARD